MNRILKISIFICVIFCAVGCTARPSTMIASTSPLPPGVRGTIKTSASNCQYKLLGIIPITPSASSADALEEAKDNVNVDVLTDVTQDYSVGYYLLWSNSCIRISGLGVPRSRF